MKNSKFWFAVLIFGFWILDLYAMDVDLWNLPIPPETQILWKDKDIELIGIKARATHLRSRLSPNEIIDFYQDILKERDWQLIHKDSGHHTQIVSFIKENKFFYLGLLDYPHSCYIYLISSPQSLAICRTLNDYLLKEEIAPDVPGKDFSDIPRYPGSKRRANIFTPFAGTVLMYEVNSPPKQIAQFYRRNLKDLGWQEVEGLDQELVEKAMEKIAPQLKDKVAILSFWRGNDFLIVNISSLLRPENFSNRKLASPRSLIIISRNIEQQLDYPEIGE